MKASELRIGNWVKGPKGARYNGSEFQWNIGEYINCNEYSDFIDDISPIPLTEEWLLKFGFKKDFDGSFVFGLLSVFKDKRLKQNVYIYTESTSKYSEGQWVVIPDLRLQHVHQLQNLYFTLTNEELTHEQQK